MDENFYEAPQNYGEEVVDSTPRPDFYVVSVKKLGWLYVLTLGLYGLYWTYKNWRIYGDKNRLEVSPFWRAIFSVFFIHELFGHIDDVGRRTAGFLPQAAALATPFVAILVGSFILGRMGLLNIGSPVTDVLGMGLSFVEAWVLMKVQKAANQACGDPEGRTNFRLTPWNLCWMIGGGLIWILALVGIFMPV